MTAALRYAARSHLGLGPKGRNEDSGYAGPHLLVLADGMGGHAAGDVASSMIVGTLAPLDEEGFSGEQALRVLGEELHTANARLRAAMDEDEDLAGMGSTTIAMLRAGSKLAMAHIGDSRAYLLREGVLSQITKDHSFVQRLLDEQRITEAEATHHPQRSLVTRVMTGNPDDEPDLSFRELHVGDRYLLCSDGLSDFVSPEILAEILAGAATPDEAADRCVEVALKAHTRDNVTVVVADVVDATDDDLPSTPQVVGAAAVPRTGRPRTRALPVSPAEKAAQLSRAATAAVTAAATAAGGSAAAGTVGSSPGESSVGAGDGPHLAEEAATPKVLWLRRAVLAAAAAVVLVGGGYAGYQWTQRQFYVGVTEGFVAVYQGVNQDIGPVHLGSVIERTDIQLDTLPDLHRTAVTASMRVADLDEAQRTVATLREVAARCKDAIANGIPCPAAPLPGATGTPATSEPVTTTTAPATGIVTVTVTGPDGSPSAVVRTVVGGVVLTPTILPPTPPPAGLPAVPGGPTMGVRP